jgi:uncharacterized iron-regulated protein
VPRDPAIFRGATGERASWEALAGAACAAEVVLLGENHGHPLGLDTAARLFDEVLAACPSASLSLEFFERDEQSRLDDYLTGISDLATFEKRTARADGNFPPGHRAMVEAAKRAGRPVHAANAPRPYVRAARKEGYERLRGLSAEQRRLFELPHELFGGRYRGRFDEVMTAEGVEETPEERAARLDPAFRSQSLWDWTMADSIVRGLERGELPVVHVVGRFHVDFGGGTVQALEELRPGTRVVVVSFADAWSDELAEADRGRADFVVYVGPAPEG